MLFFFSFPSKLVKQQQAKNVVAFLCAVKIAQKQKK